MIYGLIGGVCLLAGVAAAGSGTLNKSDNKRNKTVSVHIKIWKTKESQIRVQMLQQVR